MLLVKGLVVAATLAALTTGSSSAENTVTGVNTGADGFVEVVFDSGVPGDGIAEPLLEARCEYHTQTLPNSGVATLVIVGHATALPNQHGTAAATGVRCSAYNFFTGDLLFADEHAGPGPAHAWPFVTTIRNSAIVICAGAEAYYEDGFFDDHLQDEMCVSPF